MNAPNNNLDQCDLPTAMLPGEAGREREEKLVPSYQISWVDATVPNF